MRHNLLFRILGVMLAVALFFVLLFTSLQVIVFNMNYFEKHYTQRNIMATTEMDLPDLMYVTEEMMDYLADKRDSLDMQAVIAGEMQEVFGEREKGHMVDVKALFIQGRTIRNISFFFVLLSLVIVTIWNKKVLSIMLDTLKYVFAVLLILIGGIGLLFYIDFNKYFVMFHEIFFDNDLWLLNPRTDILINMVPQAFFFTTVMYWVILFLGSLIFVGILSEGINRKILVKKTEV